MHPELIVHEANRKLQEQRKVYEKDVKPNEPKKGSLQRFREWYAARKVGKAILAGSTLAAGSIDALAQEEFAKEPKIEISSSIGTRLASNHIVDSGTEIGKGPVLQNYATGTASYKGSSLTVLLWDNYSFPIEKSTERDIWVIANIKTPLEEHGINTSIRYQRFIYPVNPEWGQDNLAVGAVSYNGSVNITLEEHHLFPQGNTEQGDRLVLKADKQIRLSESTTLKTKVIASHEFNFFGRNGTIHATPGAEVSYTHEYKQSKVTFKGDLNYIIGIGKDGAGEPVKDMLYGGLSAGVGF